MTKHDASHHRVARTLPQGLITAVKNARGRLLGYPSPQRVLLRRISGYLSLAPVSPSWNSFTSQSSSDRTVHTSAISYKFSYQTFTKRNARNPVQHATQKMGTYPSAAQFTELLPRNILYDPKTILSTPEVPS